MPSALYAFFCVYESQKFRKKIFIFICIHLNLQKKTKISKTKNENKKQKTNLAYTNTGSEESLNFTCPEVTCHKLQGFYESVSGELFI